MSVHTLLDSTIRNFGTLLTILNENGVPWSEIQGCSKATGAPAAYAIEAVIAGETVMIFQWRVNEAIVFQSQGQNFRNRRAVDFVMGAVPEAVRRQRERAAAKQREELERKRQQQAEEQRRREAERQRLDAERRRQEEERQRRQREEDERRREEQRRRDEERRRQEEERRRQEEERLRREEAERQRLLAEQANAALARLDSGFGKPAPAPPPPPPPPPAQAAPPTANASLDKMIGKLHQENARRTVLEQLEQLQETYGLSLDGQEVLEDETIEIILRG